MNDPSELRIDGVPGTESMIRWFAYQRITSIRFDNDSDPPYAVIEVESGAALKFILRDDQSIGVSAPMNEVVPAMPPLS